MKVVQTADGSSTLFSERFGDHYHSLHGAEQEALHVFIEMGLKKAMEQTKALKILEVGFGTGLNAILTLEFASKNAISVDYTALEPFPVDDEVLSKLKYEVCADHELIKSFKEIHDGKWNTALDLTPGFKLQKSQSTVEEFKTSEKYDLIYYDAFGPRYQPEMWGEKASKKIFTLLNEKGILTTYCAQGAFRRNLEEVGLHIERLPGPPGKREMLRASKF